MVLLPGCVCCNGFCNGCFDASGYSISSGAVKAGPLVRNSFDNQDIIRGTLYGGQLSCYVGWTSFNGNPDTNTERFRGDYSKTRSFYKPVYITCSDGCCSATTYKGFKDASSYFTITCADGIITLNAGAMRETSYESNYHLYGDSYFAFGGYRYPDECSNNVRIGNDVWRGSVYQFNQLAPYTLNAECFLGRYGLLGQYASVSVSLTGIEFSGQDGALSLPFTNNAFFNYVEHKEYSGPLANFGSTGGPFQAVSDADAIQELTELPSITWDIYFEG